MKITITIATLFLLLCQASAQRTDIPITITEISPIGTENRTFYFSADSRATLGKDATLGEKEIPTIPPPSDVFYLWTVVRTPDEVWLSPLDIRKLRGGEKYFEEYRLHAAWQGDTLRFALQAGLPAFVDSVFLTDDYSDWPTNIIKFKMESGQRYSIANPSILNYVIRVYYDATSVAVEDTEVSSAQLVIAPNPVTDGLSIHNLSADATTLEVLDVRGMLCATYDASGGFAKGLSIGHLPHGAYVLVERRSNGSMRRCMFVRQ